MNIFGGLSNLFTKGIPLRKKLPTQPGDVPVPGTPPGNPANAGTDLESLMQTFANLQGKIAAPPPAAPQLKVDPLESALGSIATIFAKGEAAKTTASMAPLKLAGSRLEGERDQQERLYKIQQDSLNKQLSTTGNLINAFLDRDAVESQVKGRIQIAETQAQVKQALAGAKNNIDVINTVAKLASDGGLTAPTLALQLSSIYPDFDQEALGQMAASMMEEIDSSPVWKFRIQQAQIQLDRDELKMKELEGYRDIVNGKVPNATPIARANAAMALAQNGDKYWSQQTPDEIQKWSQTLGLVDRKIALEGDALKAEIDLKKANKKYIEEKTRVLPEEISIKVGMLDVALKGLMNDSRRLDIAGVSAWADIIKNDSNKMVEESMAKITGLDADIAKLEGELSKSDVLGKKDLKQKIEGLKKEKEFWQGRLDQAKKVNSGDYTGMEGLKKFLLPGEGDGLGIGETRESSPNVKVTRIG